MAASRARKHQGLCQLAMRLGVYFCIADLSLPARRPAGCCSCLCCPLQLRAFGRLWLGLSYAWLMPCQNCWLSWAARPELRVTQGATE